MLKALGGIDMVGIDMVGIDMVGIDMVGIDMVGIGMVGSAEMASSIKSRGVFSKLTSADAVSIWKREVKTLEKPQSRQSRIDVWQARRSAYRRG